VNPRGLWVVRLFLLRVCTDGRLTAYEFSGRPLQRGVRRHVAAMSRRSVREVTEHGD
jgi:hypothetical protein